jgi:type IV pilus assembly protein PilM
MDFLAETLPPLLKNHGFKMRKCIFSLPAASTYVQHVRMPKLTPEQTAQSLPIELQGKLPYPVEDAVVRHMVAGDIFADGESKQEVVVVAAERGVLDLYLELARKAKLDIVGINVECCAIAECFARLFRRPTTRRERLVPGHRLGQHAGGSHARRQGRLRPQPSARGRAARPGHRRGLKVPAEEATTLRRGIQKIGEQAPTIQQEQIYHLLDEPLDALAGELTQCLRYYESVFRNQGVERAIFIGGQAYDKRFCQSLARRLNLPAQIGDPLVRIKRVPTVAQEGIDWREPKPDWAVAVGLSLGANHAA